MSGTRMLVGNVLELIPGADYLPIRTVAWCWGVWLDRHPQAKAVTEAVGVGVGVGGAVLKKGVRTAGKEAAEKVERVTAQANIAEQRGVSQELVDAERNAAKKAIWAERDAAEEAAKKAGIKAGVKAGAKNLVTGEFPEEDREKSLYDVAEEAGAIPEPTSAEEPKKLLEETPANENHEDGEKLAA